jgi:hypothetical protein
MRLALILAALAIASCAHDPIGRTFARGDLVCRTISSAPCEFELCAPLVEPGALRITGRTCRGVTVEANPFAETL